MYDVAGIIWQATASRHMLATNSRHEGLRWDV